MKWSPPVSNPSSRGGPLFALRRKVRSELSWRNVQCSTHGRRAAGAPSKENAIPCGVCVTSTTISLPRPGPLYVPASRDASPVNRPAGRGAGSTAAARSSVTTAMVSGSLFVRTTTASCASGYHLVTDEKPKPPPPCPMYRRPRLSSPTTSPIEYRRRVPSLSVAGLVISAYDLGVSTLPPCSAFSHVIRSSAVEQIAPAA